MYIVSGVWSCEHVVFLAAALRGVAIQRGRARAGAATFPAAAAAAAAFARHPSPLTAATALHGYTP